MCFFFIAAREKATMINLTFIKVIVPLPQEVIPFVERIEQQLSRPKPISVEELPFEFEVLEMTLKTIYTYLDSN